MTRNTCIHISLGGPAQDRAGRRAESGERNAKKERARGQAVNTWPTLIRSACLVQPCNRNRNPSKSISNYPTLPHHPSSNLKPSVLHTMAEAAPTEAAPTEPQARHVVYCGGTSRHPLPSVCNLQLLTYLDSLLSSPRGTFGTQNRRGA